MHRLLYLVTLTLVLALGACGNEPAPADASAASTSDTLATTSPDEQLGQILVLGNSIAAGYGLDQPERQAFPALLQQKIDSLGWRFEVRNAGVSGLTTSGGLSRIDWLLRRPVDVLVLELGGNDGLRGIDLDVTRRNLNAIIDSTQARYPEARILLTGMQIPPNLGEDYTRRFRELYPEVAEAQGVELVPFLLEDVGGVAALNQRDGIHPTAEGQRIVAANVWNRLRPLLREVQSDETLAAADDCEAGSMAFDTSASFEQFSSAAPPDSADCE